MFKTERFIKSAVEKGIFDDAVTKDNGWDIQYKNNIVSVRLNNKGGALIYNSAKKNVFEVSSGRLDDVLHRYIVQSMFGTQTKTGTRNTECKSTFFVPTKVIQNSVIFEDSVGRTFTVKNATPKAVLSYFNSAKEVNADDCLLLLNDFEIYKKPAKEIVSHAEMPELEVQLLKCSADFDDYAVAPKADFINDVGQTIVGNFLCSSADKFAEMTFEEDVENVFNAKDMKHNITSSTIRTKNEYADTAKKMLANSRKEVAGYVNAKYPDGLCVSAMQKVMAYETPSLLKASKLENKVEELDYKKLFASYLRGADEVTFRLDSNKSLLSAVSVNGKSVAKFRSIPELSAVKSALIKAGYLLTELESGVTFDIENEAIAGIANACKNFVPVNEKAINSANKVLKIVGNECTELLSSYGIVDEKKSIPSVIQIVVN